MRPNIFYSAGCLFRLGWSALVTVAVIAFLKQFVFDIIPVKGDSMFPNFHSDDWIVLNKISYNIAHPQRGDSVVLEFPGDPENARYIKRLIGLPGETLTLKDGHVYINGALLRESYLDSSIQTQPDQEITLGSDQYFLLGDNRPISSDSRIWGVANSADFIGKAVYIIFPTDRFMPVVNPVY